MTTLSKPTSIVLNTWIAPFAGGIELRATPTFRLAIDEKANEKADEHPDEHPDENADEKADENPDEHPA